MDGGKEGKRDGLMDEWMEWSGVEWRAGGREGWRDGWMDWREGEREGGREGGKN